MASGEVASLREFVFPASASGISFDIGVALERLGGGLASLKHSYLRLTKLYNTSRRPGGFLSGTSKFIYHHLTTLFQFDIVFLLLKQARIFIFLRSNLMAVPDILNKWRLNLLNRLSV